MEILGIGASELIFILLIAIIVLGPKDMQKAGKTVGRWLNQFVKSDGWKALQRASKEVRGLLMREANLEEFQKLGKDIQNNIEPRPRPSVSGLSRSVPPSNETETSPTDHPSGNDITEQK
jgi:sec-independent protein translocase protein TatB